jgi:membrane protein DedA with SNARE-associated domain
VTPVFSDIIAFVSAHPHWAYATVALVALLEAVPVFGSLIPGSSLIVGLSALIATGALDLPGMLVSAIVGALLGDVTAFAVGYKEQRKILRVWPLSIYPRLVETSEAFFRDHGRLAILIGRFVAPIRAFVPITAGALGMPPRTFILFDFVAIVIWASAHILPGMVAGSLLDQWGARVEHYLLPAIAAGAAIWLVIWAVLHWRHTAARTG